MALVRIDPDHYGYASEVKVIKYFLETFRVCSLENTVLLKVFWKASTTGVNQSSIIAQDHEELCKTAKVI